MDIEVFDPGSAPAERWRRYHRYRRQRHLEHHPDDPLDPDTVVETWLKSPDPFQVHLRAEAVVDGATVGWLHAQAASPASPEYESSRHLAWASGAVLAAERRRGIGSALLEPLIGFMKEHGHTVASMDADEESGHAFLRRLGAEKRFEGGDNRLDLSQLDWDLVEAWAEAGPRRSAGSRLEMYRPRLPEAILDGYLPAYNEMINTIPWEEMEHGDIVYSEEVVKHHYGVLDRLEASHHVALTREPDGRISGVTEIIHYPHQPDRVHQELTAVQAWAQGRGLGKWLKAAMLLHVRDLYPAARFVITQNAGSNAPMLAINQRLGFRQHHVEATYQVGLEALQQRAGQLSSTL